MESSSSSTSSNFLSCLISHSLLFRPVLAILFVLSFTVLWWLLAWSLVLVHVPLVQEIFGLRQNRSNQSRLLVDYPDIIAASMLIVHFSIGGEKLYYDFKDAD